MPTTVKVDMGICARRCDITAKLRPDGDTVDITVVTDCDQVAKFVDLLGPLHMSDLVEYEGSHINDPEVRRPLTITCVAPIAVLNAAWMEAGMMSRTAARNSGPIKIEFDV